VSRKRASPWKGEPLKTQTVDGLKLTWEKEASLGEKGPGLGKKSRMDDAKNVSFLALYTAKKKRNEKPKVTSTNHSIYDGKLGTSCELKIVNAEPCRDTMQKGQECMQLRRESGPYRSRFCP